MRNKTLVGTLGLAIVGEVVTVSFVPNVYGKVILAVVIFSFGVLVWWGRMDDERESRRAREEDIEELVDKLRPVIREEVLEAERIKKLPEAERRPTPKFEELVRLEHVMSGSAPPNPQTIAATLAATLDVLVVDTMNLSEEAHVEIKEAPKGSLDPNA